MSRLPLLSATIDESSGQRGPRHGALRLLSLWLLLQLLLPQRPPCSLSLRGVTLMC